MNTSARELRSDASEATPKSAATRVRSPKWCWTGVFCGNQRSREAVHSWVSGFVGNDWGLPLAAQVQEHTETGAEGDMRVLYRRPDGALRQITRRRNARTIKYIIGTPDHALVDDLREPDDGAGHGTASTADASRDPGRDQNGL